MSLRVVILAALAIGGKKVKGDRFRGLQFLTDIPQRKYSSVGYCRDRSG